MIDESILGVPLTAHPTFERTFSSGTSDAEGLAVQLGHIRLGPRISTEHSLNF
jgi:hypothetical protein